MEPIKQITEMLRGDQTNPEKVTQAADARVENLTVDQTTCSQDKAMSNEQNTQPTIQNLVVSQQHLIEGDPEFNLEAIRLPQNFGESSGIKKLLTTVPVRKPNKTVYFRTHPEFRMDVSLLEYGYEKDLYVVPPELVSEVGVQTKPTRLVLAVDRYDKVFIWPLTIPDSENPLLWHTSAMEADVVAQKEWIRIEADKAGGSYEVTPGKIQIYEPAWPDVPWNQLVSIAFKKKIIDKFNHPVLQKLRGEL